MTEPPPQLKRTRSRNMKDLPPKLTYRSVKTSLKSVVRNNLTMEKLTDAAFRVNSIMPHALQLLKLYLLHCCGVGDELPKLDRRFVISVVKVLCKTPSTGSPPSAETQIIMDVYLIDEFHTSSRCSACEQGECETSQKCENPRPYRSGIILHHGLVKCTACSRLWNRDTNAMSNIWKAATRAIRGEGRSVYLQRAPVRLRRLPHPRSTVDCPS